MSIVAKYVGLDVHKSSIAIAVASAGADQPIHHIGSVSHDVPRLIKRLLTIAPAEELEVVYESGPTGFGLCRALRAAGIRCSVIASSRTPVRPGDRVKTDRRDAEKLARFLRSNELTAIDLPDVEREALRDLARARFDAVLARHVARQQLSSFPLRHDRRWDMKSAWTKKHFEWIRRQHFDIEAQRRVLEDYIAEVLHTDLRVELAGNYTEIERARESFPLTYLPEQTEGLFREALQCYASGYLSAFAALCRRTAQSLFHELGELGKLELFDTLQDIRVLAELDDEAFSVLRGVIFGSDSDPWAHQPQVDSQSAGILLEVMKDLLYQTFVRKSRLQQAMTVRRYLTPLTPGTSRAIS